MAVWSQFNYWNKFMSKEGHDWNPFQGRRVTEDSVFIYAETTAPLPCCATSGAWFAYPGIKEAIAHLQFVLLPNNFAIWLGREGWGENGSWADTETILADARAQDCPYAADIPLMARIACLVTEAAKVEDAPTAMKSVEKALRLFNGRWGHTPTWDLQLKLFKTVASVSKDIAKRNNCADIDPQEFRKIAGDALVDPKAEKAFRTVLAEVGVG